MIIPRFEIGKLNNDSFPTFQNPYTHAPQAPIFSCNGIDIFYQARQYKPDMGQIEPLQRDSDSRAEFSDGYKYFRIPAESVFPLGRGIALTDALLFLNEEWAAILMQDTTI